MFCGRFRHSVFSRIRFYREVYVSMLMKWNITWNIKSCSPTSTSCSRVKDLPLSARSLMRLNKNIFTQCTAIRISELIMHEEVWASVELFCRTDRCRQAKERPIYLSTEIYLTQYFSWNYHVLTRQPCLTFMLPESNWFEGKIFIVCNTDWSIHAA